MLRTILDLRNLPDFSERCVTLAEGAEFTDPRFARLRPLAEWWAACPDKPPPRKSLDPFSFGGGLVSYLVMLDVIEDGEDFRWRLFGGRHVQEFGADLKNVSIQELMQDHPAAIQFKNVMQATVARRSPAPFEIRYFSQQQLLREAIGLFMPLTDEAGAISYLFGAADWVVLHTSQADGARDISAG